MAAVADGGGPKTKYSNGAVLVIAAIAGLWLVPYLARNVNATMINGFLTIVLVGAILGNTKRWLPYVNQLGDIAK